MREFAKHSLSFENAQNSEFAQCASLLNIFRPPSAAWESLLGNDEKSGARSPSHQSVLNTNVRFSDTWLGKVNSTASQIFVGVVGSSEFSSEDSREHSSHKFVSLCLSSPSLAFKTGSPSLVSRSVVCGDFLLYSRVGP